MNTMKIESQECARSFHYEISNFKSAIFVLVSEKESPVKVTRPVTAW
jgi:hypothetical protein